MAGVQRVKLPYPIRVSVRCGRQIIPVRDNAAFELIREEGPARAPHHDPPSRDLCSRLAGPGDAARLPGRLAGLSEWCQLAGQTALPATPETVADHLASLATTSAACVRSAAVAWAIALAEASCSAAAGTLKAVRALARSCGTERDRSSGQGRAGSKHGRCSPASSGHVGSPVFSA
jgi:hypothetical protein